MGGRAGVGPASSAAPTDIRITPAVGRDAAKGVLAYVACRYGGLWIDGFTVRRRADGQVVIGFPARRDSCGRRHYVVTAASPETSETLERSILAAFREERP
jgi:hypothetical protein